MRPCRVIWTTLALATLLGARASASNGTGSAWPEGTLLYVSEALPRSSPGSSESYTGVVVLNAPVGAGETPLIEFENAQFNLSTASYDPARGRLIVPVQSVFEPLREVRAVAPDGTWSLLPQVASQTFQPYHAAAAGNGYIYLLDLVSGVGQTTQIKFYTPTDGVGTLKTADGLADYALPTNLVRSATYDPATRVLYAVARADPDTTVFRVPIAASGDRLGGPVTSITTSFSDQIGEEPVQITLGPGGRVFVKADDNSNSAQPRMQTFHPVTLAPEVFATSGYFGVAGETGGAYVPELGGTLAVDTLGNRFRLFNSGDSGTGTDLGPAPSAAGSGERINIIRVWSVPPLLCDANLTTSGTNPGDPCYGVPDGVVNGADLSYYVEIWLAGLPRADLTTNGANPGDPGFGSPDGLVNGADLSFYIEAWLAGCP